MDRYEERAKFLEDQQNARLKDGLPSEVWEKEYEAEITIWILRYRRLSKTYQGD